MPQQQNPTMARLPLLAVFTLLSSSFSVLAADHNELIDGDLSGDPANPTGIAVDAGPNVISGGVTDNPLDQDFFTLVVPNGLEVTEIQLTFFELITSPSDGGMLTALEQGPQITDLNSSANLRGFAIVGVNSGTQQGDDLLDDLGGGVLAAGEWTVWVQNTGSVTDYELTVLAGDAVVAPPNPSPRTVGIPSLGFAGMIALMLGILLLVGQALRTRPGD